MKATVAGLAAAIVLVLAASAGAGLIAGIDTASAVSPAALVEIPASLLPVYQEAASTCAGLPWTVLAAIGWMESRHADSRADPLSGAVSPPTYGPPLDGRDGRALIADPSSPDGYLHAEGPMQFLPATFAEWATLAPGRPAGAVPDPQNAWDAIYTAARMLCGGHPSIGDLRAALFGYNPSVAYVDAVLSKATSYSAFDASAGDAVAAPPDETLTAGDAATVVSAALSQVGVPYVWGGATPGVGLDCSGLVVVAYHAAGITLPRTTFEQARVGITVPVAQLAPADLLFFRGGDPADDLGHVALYLGGGAMVDAPHTGAAVRVEAVPYGEVQLVRRVIADP